MLPVGTPIHMKDKLVSELFIPENTNVIVGIKGVNCDESIWGPDAHEWKPERWLSPLSKSVANAGIPGVYSNTCVYPLPTFVSCYEYMLIMGTFRLTFLGGGRACM